MWGSLPHQVSVKLNVEAPSVSLSTQLLHRGAGGAEHQLQICLRGGAGLRARGRWLWIHGAPVETHTAPPRVPIQPVPLSGSEPGFSRHAAATPVALHVALLTQKYSFLQALVIRCGTTADSHGGSHRITLVICLFVPVIRSMKQRC